MLLQAEERSQAQMSALDAQYQAKIMAEVERYQALVQEKEMLAERCGRAVPRYFCMSNDTQVAPAAHPPARLQPESVGRCSLPLAARAGIWAPRLICRHPVLFQSRVNRSACC